MNKTKKHLRLILLSILVIVLLITCVYKPSKKATNRPLHQKQKIEKTLKPIANPIKKPKPVPAIEATKKSSKPLKILKARSAKVRSIKKPPPIRKYYPYIEIGGTRFFNSSEPSWAVSLDMFVPIWQSLANRCFPPEKIVFINPRYTDRPGSALEINLHAGYRQLLDCDTKMIGIYAGFDRKRTNLKDYFNQIMFGVEYWQELSRGNVFFGANFYEPIDPAKFIGTHTEKDIESYKNRPFKNIGITKDLQYEKAMSGFDAEFGYEFIQGLILYLGAYYFGASNMDPIYGPKARLTWDIIKDNGNKVLGMFDKVGLVIGAQNDNPRGFTAYIGLNVRLNWLKNKQRAFSGVTHHMLDLVRRDIDVVSDSYAAREYKKYQEEIEKQEVNLPPLVENNEASPPIADNKPKEESEEPPPPPPPEIADDKPKPKEESEEPPPPPPPENGVDLPISATENEPGFCAKNHYICNWKYWLAAGAGAAAATTATLLYTQEGTVAAVLPYVQKNAIYPSGKILETAAKGLNKLFFKPAQSISNNLHGCVNPQLSNLVATTLTLRRLKLNLRSRWQTVVRTENKPPKPKMPTPTTESTTPNNIKNIVKNLLPNQELSDEQREQIVKIIAAELERIERTSRTGVGTTPLDPEEMKAMLDEAFDGVVSNVNSELGTLEIIGKPRDEIIRTLEEEIIPKVEIRIAQTRSSYQKSKEKAKYLYDTVSKRTIKKIGRLPLSTYDIDITKDTNSDDSSSSRLSIEEIMGLYSEKLGSDLES